MKKKSGKKKIAPSLRAAAEGRLSLSAGVFPLVQEKSPEALVHELMVHQIELEMQNDELREARSLLEETRDKYIDLYDFAPVGYFTFTRDSRIKEMNLTAASLLGVERQKVSNSGFLRFVSPADRAIWERHLIAVFQDEDKPICELKIIRADGSFLQSRLESLRLDADAGTFRTVISDITAQKKAEEELQKYAAELAIRNRELQESLALVQQLSGMLPICASCKKIRDDKGHWSTVEAYITRHSQAVFTHGICPECEIKAYKELDKFIIGGT